MNPPARSEMPAVSLAGLIYVPGGFGGESHFERYDPATDQWQPLTEMPGGRHHLMAAVYGEQIYVFGGALAGTWTPTDTVWQYDPASDTWRELNPMPEQRLAGAAVSLGETIYVVGGAGGSEALLAFRPDTGQWHAPAGPQQPREHVSAVAYQGELWVLGGRWFGVGELATTEIYDPASGIWRTGPDLNVARAGSAAAVVNGQIVIAGGEVIINNHETLASFEMFDPGNGVWQLGPDQPVPMHGVGGAADGDRFILLGGSIEAGAIQNEGQVQIYEPF
jgi:N-acetylneuraminic acid mutarotase